MQQLSQLLDLAARVLDGVVRECPPWIKVRGTRFFLFPDFQTRRSITLAILRWLVRSSWAYWSCEERSWYAQKASSENQKMSCGRVDLDLRLGLRVGSERRWLSDAGFQNSSELPQASDHSQTGINHVILSSYRRHAVRKEEARNSYLTLDSTRFLLYPCRWC